MCTCRALHALAGFVATLEPQSKQSLLTGREVRAAKRRRPLHLEGGQRARVGGPISSKSRYAPCRRARRLRGGAARAPGMFVVAASVPSVREAVPSLAYCNTDYSTGRVPALPADATLRQVHVLIRHGARAPADNRPCWSNDTVEFVCDDASLFGHITHPTQASLPHLLFRKDYMQNQLRGTCTTGQLVKPGYEMEWASGTHLKQLYASLLPTTFEGNEGAFYLRSDDSERTMQSGASLFSGMYPNETAIVPMHTILPEALGGVGDTLLPSVTACPALDEAYRRAASTTAFVEHERARAESLTPRLVAAIGEEWTMTATDHGSSPYIHLLDHLMSHICPTVPSRGGGPPDSFTPELQQQVIDEAAFEVWSLYNQTDVTTTTQTREPSIWATDHSLHAPSGCAFRHGPADRRDPRTDERDGGGRPECTQVRAALRARQWPCAEFPRCIRCRGRQMAPFRRTDRP